MDKDGFIDILAQKTGITKVEAKAVTEASITIISDALISGDRVQFLGFGTFEVKNRAPRMGRNPKANTPVAIPAQKVPTFKPGKSLKVAVNGANKD